MKSNLREDQPFAVRVLEAHLRRGRTAHSYLISGEGPKTKEALALGFAGALQCDEGRGFADCDCLSCRKVENRGHPDLHFLGEDLKAKSIKIEDVRTALEQAALKPYEGKWKIFVVLEADRLTGDAANAFLKTLEEPPAHTVFLLTAENRGTLLETIQSRCFEVRLRPLKEVFAASGLQRWDFRGARHWIGALDPLQDLPRPDLGLELARLLEALTVALWRHAEGEGNLAAQDLEAVDAVLEALDALEANGNAKLALTRLEIKLERTLPLEVLA